LSHSKAAGPSSGIPEDGRVCRSGSDEGTKVTFLKIYKFGVFRGAFAPFHPLKKLKKLKIRLRLEKVCDVVHPPVCRIEELALPLWPCTSPRRRNTSNSRTIGKVKSVVHPNPPPKNPPPENQGVP